MKTKVELGKDGSKTIYHQTDRYSWTHSPEESSECQACANGTLPDEVKRGNGKT